MKSRFHHSLNVGTLIAVTTVFCTDAVGSEPAGKSADSTAKSNAIPQSVYVVPSNSKDPKDGRDPFYPNSTRLNQVVHSATSKAPTVTLILNGLSPGLAMINGRTMAPGEESDVNTSTRRVHIRLVEIKEKEKTVVVEVEGGERQELRLRAGN